MKHRNFKQSLTTPEKERTELREQKCSGMQTTEIMTFHNYTGYLYPYKPNALLMIFYGDDP